MILNDTKEKFRSLMIENELGGNLNDAYVLTKCGAGKSGYSFGLIQMDLSVNSTGRDIFKSAIVAGGITNSFVEMIMKKVINYANILTKDELAMINEALSKPAARLIVDRSFDLFYDSYASKIDRFIKIWSKVESKKLFLSKSFTQLFLFDYNNQFNISAGGKFDVFISGLDKINSFEMLRYLMNTKYATDKLAQKKDLIRRFSNVIKFSEKKLQITTRELLHYQDAAKKDKDLQSILALLSEIKTA